MSQIERYAEPGEVSSDGLQGGGKVVAAVGAGGLNYRKANWPEARVGDALGPVRAAAARAGAA